MGKSLFIIIVFTLLSLHLPAQTFEHPAGQYLTVNGVKLWIEIDGSGDPLFLISGGPGGSHVGMHGFDGLKDFHPRVY